MTEQGQKIPSIYGTLLRRLIAVLLLSYVVWYFIQNRQQIESLKRLSLPVLGALTLLTVLGLVIHAVRFRMVVQKKSGLALPWGPWIQFFVVSRFLSLYAGQAGNLYRAIKLKYDYRVSLTRYISSTLFLAWFDACFALLAGSLIIRIFAGQMQIFGLHAAGVLILLLGLFFIAPFIFRWITSGLRFRRRFFIWIHQRLSDMSLSIVHSMGDLTFLLKLTASGCLSHISSILAIYMAFRGLGIPLDLPSAALFFTVLTLLNQIVITPGNLGIKEVAYGILAQQLQIGMAQGILVSLILRVLTLVVTTALGLAFGGRGLLSRSGQNRAFEPADSAEAAADLSK